MRQALPAFARRPALYDAWPGSPTAFAEIRASRRIATLAHPPLQLYLLVTARSGTCLELVGIRGDCNDAANFFGQSHLQLLEATPVVAGVLDLAVVRVQLRTPAGTRALPLNTDRGILFLCPQIPGRRSCAGKVLVGLDRQGRQLFAVSL